MSHDFPHDLVQLQRHLHAATADLRAFLHAHPEPPEPINGTAGWSAEDKAREVELRQRLQDLIDQVHTHPYWDTLSGTDLVTARMRLKHVDDEPGD
ncbi:hypothetical protein OIU81_03050 [Streptomyces sp. NBC_01454]|uniref:hypothetical protein n=1 Tax=Streptomyces sp. NBC_01454 TaxID=2975867 RepID=UPI002E3481CC|nr:hypothetical protein [Streptomyces sp. NBC_01454]